MINILDKLERRDLVKLFVLSKEIYHLCIHVLKLQLSQRQPNRDVENISLRDLQLSSRTPRTDRLFYVDYDLNFVEFIHFDEVKNVVAINEFFGTTFYFLNYNNEIEFFVNNIICRTPSKMNIESINRIYEDGRYYLHLSLENSKCYIFKDGAAFSECKKNHHKSIEEFPIIFKDQFLKYNKTKNEIQVIHPINETKVIKNVKKFIPIHQGEIIILFNDGKCKYLIPKSDTKNQEKKQKFNDFVSRFYVKNIELSNSLFIFVD